MITAITVLRKQHEQQQLTREQIEAEISARLDMIDKCVGTLWPSVMRAEVCELQSVLRSACKLCGEIGTKHAEVCEICASARPAP